MSMVINIAVIALLSSLCGLLLKRSNSELALLISVCGVAVIFASVFPDIELLTGWIDKIYEMGMPEEILDVLLKVLGTSIAAKMAANLCSDCGESSLAFSVEFSAKIVVLLFSLPLIDRLLGLVEEVLRI